MANAELVCWCWQAPKMLFIVLFCVCFRFLFFCCCCCWVNRLLNPSALVRLLLPNCPALRGGVISPLLLLPKLLVIDLSFLIFSHFPLLFSERHLHYLFFAATLFSPPTFLSHSVLSNWPWQWNEWTDGWTDWEDVLKLKADFHSLISFHFILLHFTFFGCKLHRSGEFFWLFFATVFTCCCCFAPLPLNHREIYGSGPGTHTHCCCCCNQRQLLRGTR